MWKHSANRRSDAAGPARPRRLVRRLLGAGLPLVALCGVLWTLNRPIRAVTVTGAFRHVAPLAVEQAVASVALGSGLLTVDLDRVRAAVAALPWVAAVSVRRIWPDVLAVQVSEQVAVACWNGDGLVNRDGTLFVTGVAHPPPALARLSGPSGAEADVTRRYLSMSGQLAPTGFSIASLSLDARGTWQFTLRDGITVRLGRSEVDARFDKFINVALTIVERRAQAISYIDMRYMNGFAIGRAALKRRAPAQDARAVGPAARDGQWHAQRHGERENHNA